MNQEEEPFHITEADFTPIDNAPFLWRWDDVVKAGIHLLRPSTSAAVKEVMIAYTGKWGRMLSKEYFPAVELIETHKDTSTIVEGWLCQHSPAMDQDVLVSYVGRPEVYLVNWNVFCTHWEGFCYPGDEVVICPRTEEWVLYYYHEEVFYWGRPNRKASVRPACPS